MYELDDIVQHYGVKGMRWGVRRTKAQLQKAAKGHIKRRNAKERKKLDDYHEKKMAKNDGYVRAYKHLREKKNTKHYAAVRKIRDGAIAQRNNLLGQAAVIASPFIMNRGAIAAKQLYNFSTDPVNVRRGKNIVQAVKRSPLRYVDGKTMTNVVRDM